MTVKEIHELTKQLIGRFDKMGFVGPGWSGEARRGFMFNPEAARSSGGGGGGPSNGACCVDEVCSVMTSDACLGAGGVFLGNGTTCDGVDCTQGACCATDGSCSVTTAEDCTGVYQGDGTDCEPNPCPAPPSGACCVGTDCSIETEEDCEGMEGTYQGDDTTCDPNPCEPGGACCHPHCAGCDDVSSAFECDGSFFPGQTCGDITCHGDVIASCAQTSYAHYNFDNGDGSTSSCNNSFSRTITAYSCGPSTCSGFENRDCDQHTPSSDHSGGFNGTFHEDCSFTASYFGDVICDVCSEMCVDCDCDCDTYAGGFDCVCSDEFGNQTLSYGSTSDGAC